MTATTNSITTTVSTSSSFSISCSTSTTMTMFANKEVSWYDQLNANDEYRRRRRRRFHKRREGDEEEIGQNVVDEEEGVAVTRKEIWASKYKQNVKDIIFISHSSSTSHNINKTAVHLYPMLLCIVQQLQLQKNLSSCCAVWCRRFTCLYSSLGTVYMCTPPLI